MLTKNGALFFQLLASKFCKSGVNGLSRMLPLHISQAVQAAPSLNSKDPTQLLFSPFQWVRSIHYSWLLEALQKMPSGFQKAVISAMPHDIAAALAPEENTLPHYSEKIAELIIRSFHATFLSHEPEAQSIMPKALMPPTDLDWMLTLSKQNLVELIDLMAMYDLADEVRHVVDRKLLQMIVGRLTQTMQRFLRSCMSQKTKLALSPLHIEQIYKDEKQFHKILHKRGIQRLSIALSGQSVDFIWHILHTLDTGRGRLLKKQIQNDVQPTTAPAKMQLMVTLQYMKDMRKNP